MKFRFDGWVFDPASGDLKRDGAQARLQEQPARVLQELIAHPGSVVTREQLIALLWPKGVVDFDTGLNTVIRKLRSALGDVADTPRYIETLPRRGYRWIAALEPEPGGPSRVPAAPVTVAASASTVASEVTRSAELATAQQPALPTAETSSEPDAHSTSAGRHTAAIWAILAGVSLALGAAYLHVRRLQRSPASPAATTAAWNAPRAQSGPTAAPSIAVLPFVDMSEKQDLGYFADGLAEELIDLLSRGSDLRVPARTSSFYFKGKSATLREIASALSVDTVLEGSVRRSGSRVRVTTQLIRADTGYHLWSQTYDLELTELFATEDEIARAVTGALQAKLTAVRVGSAVTGEATNQLLLCRFFRLRNTRADAAKAVDCYRQLLALAPDDAAAWAGYAEALWRRPLLEESSLYDMRAAYVMAHQAAERAVALDPAMALAHVRLAAYHGVVEHDWAAANTEIKAALIAEPQDPFALLEAARFAMNLGQFDAAIELCRRARERDPLNPLSYVSLGLVDLYRGRLAEAELESRRRLDLSPDGAGAHFQLASVLLARAQPQAALATIAQESDADSRLEGFALVYYALGRHRDADAALAELVRRYSDRTPKEIADIYAYRGDADRAFAWLERAASLGDPALLEIKWDDKLKALKTDPRYAELLRRLGLPERDGASFGPRMRRPARQLQRAPLCEPEGACCCSGRWSRGNGLHPRWSSNDRRRYPIALQNSSC